MFDRWYASELQVKLSRPYVHLLFGARQTGKSTLLNGLIPEDALRFNLADPQERSRHLGHPGEFAQACLSLSANKKGQFVFVDEAQSVPAIFDAVQALYDADKTRWRFVLCGSSARKLRLTGANLLPGRSLRLPDLSARMAGWLDSALRLSCYQTEDSQAQFCAVFRENGCRKKSWTS